MGVDPWVDRGTCHPNFFEVEGTPCVVSSYFFGGRHFCTNPHGIHWIIGTILVSQLILMKIIQIVATRCPILRLKRNKFNFGWGSAPADPAGELTALPRPLPGFNGPTSKGREGERWKWRERKGPLYFFLRIL